MTRGLSSSLWHHAHILMLVNTFFFSPSLSSSAEVRNSLLPSNEITLNWLPSSILCTALEIKTLSWAQFLKILHLRLLNSVAGNWYCLLWIPQVLSLAHFCWCLRTESYHLYPAHSGSTKNHTPHRSGGLLDSGLVQGSQSLLFQADSLNLHATRIFQVLLVLCLDILKLRVDVHFGLLSCTLATWLALIWNRMK